MSVPLLESLRPQHAQLLQRISELDWAAPALAQQSSFVFSLEKSLNDLSQEIPKLAKVVDREHEDVKTMESSVFEKFWYKATTRGDKFSEKLDKERK